MLAGGLPATYNRTMPRCWSRLLPILFAALWLPLQAVAALTMPFCTHAHGQASGQTPAAMEHPCHEGQSDRPAGQHDGYACDQCGFCHLACAGMAPASLGATAPLPAGDRYGRIAVAFPPDHIPEPLQPPPRSI
jgi:hypothetical protein